MTTVTRYIEKVIVRETEKAVLVSIYSCDGPGQVWLPKSQVTIEEDRIEVPQWLLDAKGRDVGPIVTLNVR